LFEFPCPENEITGRNLISETLPDLPDSEREFAARASLDVFKIYENALSGLGTEINGVFFFLDDALIGFEHQIEFSDVCEIMGTAARTFHFFFFYESEHFCVAHAVSNHFSLCMLFD
jgi:hypothetical protein